MDRQKQIDTIAGYYMPLRDFKKSEKYSSDYRSVYTANGGAEWLVLERRDKNAIQARRTDDKGVVVAWDNYTVSNASITLVDAVRRSRSKKQRITFTPDELSILRTFGEDGRWDTSERLQATVPKIKDETARAAALRVADKAALLSEAAYAELITTTNTRYKAEDARSIHTRLARAKAKSAELDQGAKARTKRREDRTI